MLTENNATTHSFTCSDIEEGDYVSFRLGDGVVRTGCVDRVGGEGGPGCFEVWERKTGETWAVMYPEIRRVRRPNLKPQNYSDSFPEYRPTERTLKLYSRVSDDPTVYGYSVAVELWDY